MEGSSINSEENSIQEKEFCPKVRWMVPQDPKNITFIGKDVLAVCVDIYIMFLNLKNSTELVYVANSEERGDGVDCLAGYKTTFFAFAEKRANPKPRLFIMQYPTFHILAELSDPDVNRYKSVCMMESDLVCTFSGFPDYTMAIWSWRTKQRLVRIATGVVKRSQIYMPSRTHMLVCECWGEGLIVWDVNQCFKHCLVMRRATPPPTSWEQAGPHMVAVCWRADGQLYAIDKDATLYAVASDGINMVLSEEWSAAGSGAATGGVERPCICGLGSGLLLYGSDGVLRYLKKVDNKWKVSDSERPSDPALLLVSSWGLEGAALWTRQGLCYKVALEGDERLTVTLVAFKQRNIKKMQFIAPDFEYCAALDDDGIICIYDIMSSKLIARYQFDAADINFKASPKDPLLVVTGSAGPNYGLVVLGWSTPELQERGRACLTHQVVSRVAFSADGRYLMAAAMSAGHVFIYKVSQDYQLELMRYAELGRGLADVCLMKVGDSWRSFNLVLYSDKYPIGERIMVINAETGKDNKFAGKMQGPYTKLLPLAVKDTMIAIPHLSTNIHILKLSGEKGITVTVKVNAILNSHHLIKYFYGSYNSAAVVTYGYGGTVVMRLSHSYEEPQFKMVVTHRYNSGIRSAIIDEFKEVLISISELRNVVIHQLDADNVGDGEDTKLYPPDLVAWKSQPKLNIIGVGDKNYLDLQEDKKVNEEALDYKSQRADILKSFLQIQAKVVALLEENLQAPPLHQLSLSEFNLHQENKRERYKQAEREREEIRLKTEALIRAQDKVTAWIKANCWDKMATQRVKILAIFSHYQVENFPIMPYQRDQWPELQQILALRNVEMDNDKDLFRPWEPLEVSELEDESPLSGSALRSRSRMTVLEEAEAETRDPRDPRDPRDTRDTRATLYSIAPGAAAAEVSVVVGGENPHVLRPSAAHNLNIHLPDFNIAFSLALTEHTPITPEADKVYNYIAVLDCFWYIDILPELIPQTLAFSYLQEYYIRHLTATNVMKMRAWFNKEFDDLMNQKKREVSLVEERNARLRFIIEELNKLSDLRGSFHHLAIAIRDPRWEQVEQPSRLIKVDPEECSIEPYVSPSQIVLPPPEPQPKDDFKERALMDMMDGVLEKLWHEEIKKPIPKPLCMLEKDPEHFNEDDLRLVFDYEAKVKFREEERDKYRKMLHAEYAKLTAIVNEGIVKFNQKVKEMWLTKLRVESVIGQERLNLMRLRRVNLDRTEMAEELEYMRETISRLESEIFSLSEEHKLIQSQSDECQAVYDSLALKDKYMERTFKNHFADLSPIIVDQCFKYYKKRPKWHQRASMIPVLLYELGTAILNEVKPPLMHPDCVEYFRGVDQLDQISNMPPVMDEFLWGTMIKLRRAKIENEIRMRAVVLETAQAEGAARAWAGALAARRAALARAHDRVLAHRQRVETLSRNKTIQLVLPAGQVEVVTTGHIEDFEDAALIPVEDIDAINNLILKVGELKLRMMKKQMEFRRGILAREWEHAQMRMKLRHMEQELYSYRRLKIPKELQQYLKEKELGYTEEKDYMRLEKEMEATKMSINRVLSDQIQNVEDIQVKINGINQQTDKLDALIAKLNVKISEKRLNEDPFEPLRIRRENKKRMDVLVQRSNLIREVQANHSKIIVLQTELELLRLKTFPTLASFRTLPT